MTVVEGVNVFFNVASGRGCTRVFELPVYLDTGACSVVLFGRLYGWDLSLLKGPFYLSVMAFHKGPVGFLLGCHNIYKRNGEYK